MLKFTKAISEQLGEGQVQGTASSIRIPLLAGDIDGGKLITLILQLAVVLFTFRVFNVEDTSAVHTILPLIFGGFIVHAIIAQAYRLPFFFFLSIAAVFAVFGMVNGAWLIGIGMALIGMCHLPIPFRARVGLILVAVAGLVVLRGGWITTSWSEMVLPILGAMFMFRLVIYLHDLRHERKPASIWERLSYFFLLPNIVFPLFPVIDYQLFRKSYYNEDGYKIYQKGVLWIFRGVTHLLLYRAVYYYLVPTPEEVQGLWQVVLFIVSSYLLYLRVSGLFHIIIGILCLFGINLPETHHHYFLAAEFNEVWRRLNIYWKDFMAKVLYYPLVMKIRKWGMMRARVLGTMLVFVATWLLHSYQWFWLRGAFPLNAIDGMYWGILGMFVVFNTVRTTKNLRQTDDDDEVSWSWSEGLRHSGRILGMFIFMSVLWSFWSSESISSWWSVMMVGASASLMEYGLLLLGIAGIFALVVAHLFMDHKGWSLLWDEKTLPFYNVAARTSVAAVALMLIGLPKVYSNLNDDSSAFIASLTEGRLNERDEDILERGYYEGLIDGNSYTSQVWWSERSKKPDNWKATMNSDAVQPGEDVLVYELIPSYSGIIKDAPFNVNQWGMRDKDYAKEKPDNTFRIAFLGASYEQGAGVDDDDVYPALLEKALNEHHGGQQYERYEVLSFAVGGYSPIQSLYLTEKRVLEFEPDVIMYAIHSTEKRRLLMQLQKIAQDNRDISYGFLNDIFAEAGITKEMPHQEARRRIDPFGEQIIKESFQHMGAISEASGVPIIGLFVPSTEEIDGFNEEWHPVLTAHAASANFAVVKVNQVFDGVTEEDIRLAPWDTHLNSKGHEILADRVYETLKNHEVSAVLGLSASMLSEETGQ